jgi:hypothetical protein
MALDYSLDIQTELHPKQALKLISVSIGSDSGVKKRNRRVFISTDASGLIISAYRFKASDPCFIAEDLGIEVSMSIGFRLSKFKDLEVQKHALLKATIELLRLVSGDAVLLFNGEVIWLLRKSGDLILNSHKDLWRPELLALVTLPYKMKDLPTL